MTALIGGDVVIAALIGVVGVSADGSGVHELVGRVTVFSYRIAGSTDGLFLHGIGVAAITPIGPSLVSAGRRRAAPSGDTTRSRLTRLCRETTAMRPDRAELTDGSRAYPHRAEPVRPARI